VSYFSVWHHLLGSWVRGGSLLPSSSEPQPAERVSGMVGSVVAITENGKEVATRGVLR
jgi:hypothetical protein